MTTATETTEARETLRVEFEEMADGYSWHVMGDEGYCYDSTDNRMAAERRRMRWQWSLDRDAAGLDPQFPD